jgi:hypothetical protein
VAKPTQGSVTSRPINMTGAPKQGPSKTIPALPGSTTPRPAVLGDSLGANEPAMRPTEGPNKKFSEGFYNK